MDKINKNTIERLTVNDKIHIWQFEYYPAKKGNFFKEAKPDRWGDCEYFSESKEKIDREGLCQIINNKIYTRPNFTIRLVSGREIIKRFDTYKEAEKFAYNYIKNHNLIDFINLF